MTLKDLLNKYDLDLSDTELHYNGYTLKLNEDTLDETGKPIYSNHKYEIELNLDDELKTDCEKRLSLARDSAINLGIKPEALIKKQELDEFLLIELARGVFNAKSYKFDVVAKASQRAIKILKQRELIGLRAYEAFANHYAGSSEVRKSDLNASICESFCELIVFDESVELPLSYDIENSGDFDTEYDNSKLIFFESEFKTDKALQVLIDKFNNNELD